MATDKTDFEVWLKSKWDGDAMKAAEADFRKTQRAVVETKESMNVMGEAASALKAQFIGLLAFAEVVAQFKEGFEQVAALEQAMNQLERATARNGDNFDEVKKKITDFGTALMEAAGVDDDAAIRAMVKLYNATGDVENAMNLVRLAADVAASGIGIEFEQAISIVTKAAQGQTRALVELNLKVDEGTGKTISAAEALERIEKAYGGAASSAKGMAVEVSKLSEEWENFRNSAVENSGPALVFLMKSLRTAGSEIYDAFAIVFDVIGRILKSLVFLGAAIGQTLVGNFQGAKDWAKAGVEQIQYMTQASIEISAEGAKRVKAIWAEGTAKLGSGPAAPLGTPGAGTGDGAGAGAGGGKGGKAGKTILGEMYGPTTKEKADYERELKESLKQAQKAHDELAAQQKRADGKELDEAGKLAYGLVKIEKERAEKERKIAEELAEQKKAAAQATAFAAIGFARSAFGESKALSIAEASISTWQGAARALKDWPAPYSYIIAAMTIASGLAQVAKITSTDATKGSGFDDPSNDAAARIGGRRWAADMIGEFTAGASAGWAQGMRAGSTSTTTNDNRRTFNVHMHGTGFIDPTNVNSMKQFHRALQIIDTQYAGQRTVARAR